MRSLLKAERSLASQVADLADPSIHDSLAEANGSNTRFQTSQGEHGFLGAYLYLYLLLTTYYLLLTTYYLLLTTYYSLLLLLLLLTTHSFLGASFLYQSHYFLGASFLYQPPPSENVRARAHDAFHKWHNRLGLELDSNQQEPVIKTVWPTFFTHDSLTSSEGLSGLANFQTEHRQKLQHKLFQASTTTTYLLLTTY